MAETKQYKLINIIAVLSVSTLLYLAQVNSATLPYLVEEFPQYSLTTVKLFTTIPSLMMIICSLVSSKLIQIFPIKKIVIGCCTLMCIAGFGTYFLTNLPAILIMRVVYGMGSGTAFPLANAIIQQLFEGDTKAKLLGYRAAFGAIFGACVSMVGGFLTSFYWRNAFFGYLFAIPIALLVFFFCPYNEPIKKEKTESAAGEKKYTTKTFLVLIFAILFNACMMTFSVELSLVITGSGAGGAQEVSMVASTNTICAFIAGLIFGSLQKKTRRYMAVISTGLMALALILGCIVQVIPLFMLCAGIYGLGFGFFNPTYNLLAASTAATPKYGSHAIAIYTSCVGIGQFLSPYMVAGVKSALGLTYARSEWMIAGTCAVILVLIALVYILLTGGNKAQQTA